ncbi:efflux transporter outer membrane subunit [Pseudaeromonas sharmana]|uniref:Efflux transporter outer membrane subunit n=1 Tax=Pseudaeromonas sharmana TaxID=328412 RepID=A0ABV8CQ78_9GAMM
MYMTAKTNASRYALSALTVSLATLLSACSVGPDYQRPEMPAVSRYARLDASVRQQPAPEAEPAFWRGFNDPELTKLVELALRHNQDVQRALANYQQANALLGSAKYDLLPTLVANAQASNERSSADQQPGVAAADRDYHQYQGSTGFSWELDLFGRVRRSVEAQRADTRASADDLAAMQVAVVGELAQTYFQLRGWQAQRQIARDNAANQAQTLSLLQLQQGAGMASAFDVDRGRAQLETTRASIPPLEAQIAVASHRIGVLTGNVPEALINELAAPAPLAQLSADVPMQAPGELLRRRPDVAAAEHRLAAATARIGVATADLFPHFTLGGLIGTQALDAGALLARDSETRSLTLGVDGSFLNVGRVRARIAASNAQAAADLASYQKSVLTALEETENALAQVSNSAQQRQHLAQAAAASVRAAEVAKVRYDEGAIDLLTLLDAENVRLQSQDALAQSQVRYTLAVVSLYRAMAGGWPDYVADEASNRP